jgi:hypothetical protein
MGRGTAHYGHLQLTIPPRIYIYLNLKILTNSSLFDYVSRQELQLKDS